MGGWVLEFAGLAIAYGIAISLGAFAILHLCGRFPGWYSLPLWITTCTFGRPDPTSISQPCNLSLPRAHCPSATSPLPFLETVWRLQRADVPVPRWFMDRTLAATAFNFIICAIIGAALARHWTRVWAAVLFGTTLSLAVELTQLTGFWGLWPCPWRQFNIDDLLMNVSGVVIGFAMIQGDVGRKRA